jgi:DNA-binding LacI/PurR family transcriptional regulator
MGGRPTINDVAERAGVSKSLVSLVLRGAGNVSDHRRLAVERAVAELGYRPNAVARSLVERRTRTVGVLVADLHNPFFPEVIDGLEEQAGALGYRALLGSGNRRPVREEQTVDAFLELQVDGLVLLSPVLRTAVVREARRAVPVVLVGSRSPGVAGVDTVSSDEAHGTALAVDYLVSLGHHRIAHIAGGLNPASDLRRRGYEAAMRAAGLGDQVRTVAGGFTTDQGGYEAMAQLLADGERPTAVLAANDLAAVGAMGTLHDAGLAVPGDVSLVGYDNSYLAGIRRLSLTSVNQPRFDMGRLAMATLHERITGAGRRAGHHVLDPDLVIRATTGPPPGHAR